MKLQLHVIGVSTLDSQSKGTKSTLDSQSKGTNASSIRRPVVNEERLSPGLATCCVQCFDTLRWQEGRPVYRNLPFTPRILFQNMLYKENEGGQLTQVWMEDGRQN